jgi:VanZ family protein
MPSNGFFGFDKILHAASYFTLIILTSWACAGQAGIQRAVLLRVGAAAILLGGLLEIAQGVLTTTRSAEFEDFLANGIGVGAAICALQFRRRLLKKTASKRERKATLLMTVGGDTD